MKTSEEMTEYVIKKLNEYRQKVSRRNDFIKKITFGLVNPAKHNALTEEFTDSEEVKGVGFMNRKISLIATTVSLMMIMTATVSIISLNMGKPDFDAATDMIESSSTSDTSTEYSTGTSASSGEPQVLTAVSSDSVYILTAKTTAVSVTRAEETRKTAKTTYLVESTQTTKVKTTDAENNTDVTAVEKEIPEQTAEPIHTEKVTKVQTTETAITAVQTEKPLHTTANNPVADESIDVFQITPSTDGVDEFMELHHEKYGHNGSGNCYNVTPKEITDKYGLCIFKFDGDGGGTIYGEGFLLYENEIYPIGCSFGGWGLTSFAVTDTDHNGSNELYFTYSCGSGIHRSALSYFDMQSKDIIYFDYEYWDYDMILSDKNGMLSICHAEEEFTAEAGIEFKAGEEIGRIGFVDDEIQLMLKTDVC
ncbi:MAG: hypothetical protein K2J47_00915 [Ruminococcus sp.]|nr:hypothetical protein [Ruminococcus sp.]